MTELGQYRLIRPLGRGGMGEVFLARDTTLRRDVAIKVLPEDVAADEERVRRFTREAHAASALSHPNIAVVYSIGSDKGRHFIAMEYVEGNTIAEAIAMRSLDHQARLRLAAEIADALDEAHTHGVIHRDLKPSNVMVTRRGHAKVLDFGLAKLAASSAEEDSATALKSREGVVLGTVQFMSPEQALGRDVDARSDIFSFGLLLYELFSGRRAFEGRNSTETIARILNEAPEPLALEGTDAPEIERIVAKCLEKRPELRYQSARDLAVDLQRLLVHSGDSGPRTGAPAFPARSARKRWFVIGTGIALLAMTTVLAAWLIQRTTTKKQIGSVIVIPFARSGVATQDDYLVDGLSDEIINSLAQLPELRVISRTTAQRFKGAVPDPRAIGRELGVDAMLTGELRARGEKADLQTELIDTRDGARLWGARYDSTISNVLSLHGSIVRDLTGSLTGDVRAIAKAQAGTMDPEAFRLYLQGRHHWEKRTYEGHRQAVTAFKAAIDRDPAFADAYVGLADSYLVVTRYSDLPSRDFLNLAEAAAKRALELDPELAEVHATLGSIREKQWRWDESEEELRTAIRLRPGYATAHHWYGLLSLTRGDIDAALSSLETAQRLDPLSPIITMAAGVARFTSGDLTGARREFDRTLEISPEFPSGLLWLGLLNVTEGRCAEGIPMLERSVRLLDRTNEPLGTLAHGYGRCGRRADAEALVAELEHRAAQGSPANTALAFALPALGRPEEAITWLERAYTEHDSDLHMAFLRPQIHELRSRPRFQAILKGMGLPVEH